MSFLDGILSVGKTAVGFLTGNSIISGLARTAILGYAVNRLSKNANKGNDPGATSNIDNGVRLQVKPNASSKIPVLYGSAFFGGNITDAAMTNANKTMWYSIVLTEKTATGSYTFNNVYWNNQRVVFNSDGITVNYTVDSGGIVDRSLSGLVKIYFYAGGRTAGQLPSGYSGTAPANAETLFPNWTSGTHAMNNLVFALVRVDYNREKNVTGLGDMLFQVSNSLTYPGDVLYDYLTSTTYGAGISGSDIISADITALNTYSQESVAYDSPSGAATLADRYQINGLLDTAKPVLENAEKILSAAASWLSYDAHDGKWGIVINKSDSSVASFNDTNILGSISLSGTGLQDLYNSTKVEFPHRELRDSADYYNIAVPTSSIPSDWTPFSRNTNEEDNVLNISYDIINEPIQAQMLGLIELKQSRLDKIIKFETDFGKYNLKAGDIIDVTNSRFGFTNEKFRIITINEVQDDGGALIMDITALQYNVNVYSIADLYRFVRSTADGIVTIGSIGTPGTPIVSKIEQDARPRTEITSTAPTGVVEGLEFWLTTDVGIPDDANRSYTLIGIKRPAGGGVYTSGTNVTLEYIPNAGNFYVKTRGFNAAAVGGYSNISGLVEFAPVQVTNAIDANTQAFNSTGGLLGALALVELLSKLSDLFPSGSTGSLFDRIFQEFEDLTGIDLVGDAAAGDLVVAADLAIKADGSSLGATTSSIDFIGPVEASGSGDVEVKLKDGTKDKDVLAWDAEQSKWRLVSDCIDCDFTVEPPAVIPATPCILSINQTLPSNNFSLGNLCPSTSSVPYTGSYFLKFSITPGTPERTGIAAASYSVGTTYKIAAVGTADFTAIGASANTVGTTFTASAPATNILASAIVVGKEYEITTAGTTNFVAIGATDNNVGTKFTATGVGTATDPDGEGPLTPTMGRVKRVFAGTGFLYSTNSNAAIGLAAPLVKGTGSFKLYGTDGKLEDTKAIAACIIHNDVIEIPFASRTPGKDYYVIWDEGIVTSCTCENAQVDNATTWTFSTSETPRTAYSLSSISPTAIPTDGLTSDASVRTDVNFTYTPGSAICSNSQKLIYTFNQKVKKGSGSVVIKDRQTQSNVASLSVSGATITEDNGNWTVDFGTITGLEVGKYYDVSSPRGILLTDVPVGTTVVCDKTTTTPALPDRKSRAKTWGFRTDIPLEVVSVEYCTTNAGNATLRSNIKITFNKNIRVKTSSPAEITINGGLFGLTHQKIDLRGTYANKKYGNIYSASSDTLIINPTKMFSPNTDYHITIPSGVIIDDDCDVVWEGVSDSTTIAWKTDGAAPTPPESLTYGSVLMKMEYDRPVNIGYGKMNVVAADGRLLTQINAKDLAVKIKYNERF